MAKRNFGTRALALLLSIVLCVSILQLQSFAAEYDNQVMDGYYVLNTDGTENGTVSESAHTEHGFTVSKTIAQTGVDAFQVTLEVKTSQTVTTSDAAVALVIDASNSMASGRLTAVKNALTKDGGFLDSLVNNQGKIFLSVIAFNNGASTVLDWTEMNDETMNGIKQSVRGISSSTGTNLEAGLMLARNKLAMSVISACSSKYTVLLSDGAPSKWMTADNTSTSAINTGISSTLSEGHAETLSGSQEMAAAVKAKSVLYTIFYGDAEKELTSESKGEICSHCQNEEDAHYALCTRCLEPRSEHRRSGNRYYCDNGRNYQEGTFCDAAGTQSFAATVIPAMTVGQFLENQIASAPGYAYDAEDEAAVNQAFSSIASAASSGMTGAGTTVTDPMGSFIVLGDVSQVPGVTANANTLSWALDAGSKVSQVTEGNTTTYTYRISYPITLDTAASGFVEKNPDGSVKYYPANGYTYLNATIEGQPVKIPFRVPGVCGKIPQAQWRVEYYKQGSAAAGSYADYTLADAQDMGTVKVWSSVEAPEGYATKFADHTFVSGATQLQITPTGENIMRLYYDRKTATVTVNHFYKTDEITPAGATVTGSYPAVPQVSVSQTENTGTLFSATPQTTYAGNRYTQESVSPSAKITVSETGDNVINFYYTRLVDSRALTEAKVEHIYTTYTYELRDGKYQLVESARVTETAQQASGLRATTTFGVSDAALAGYGEFTLNKAKGDYAALLQSDQTLSFVLADDAAQNVRTLQFDRIVDNRVAAEITVNHYYTKSVTKVVNGAVVTTVEPNGTLGDTDSFFAYVGESFTATEKNTYLGDEYVSDAGNAAKLQVENLAGDVTINLYYTIVEKPVPVAITVNHYWRTFTTATVEVVENGKVTGYTTEKRTTVDHKQENLPITGLYAGQSFTADLIYKEGGYAFQAAESNRTITVTDGAVINLYYDRENSVDERGDANIDVLHKYTTVLTTVVGGEVTEVTVEDGTQNESFTGLKAGERFTAVPKPEFDGNVYVQTPGTELTKLLQPGTNGTITIPYTRTDSDLVAVDYAVRYVYRTYTMTVNAAGAAGYWNAPTEETAGSFTGEGYVGQRIQLPAGGKDGFRALENNPGTVQILQTSGNTWTFVYERYIPLGTGSVTVNHHYKTTEIAVNGTASHSTQDVLGNAVEKYLGESFPAASVPNGYTLVKTAVDGAEQSGDVVVTVSGDHVVDFYYEKTVDHSVMAAYSIQHIYNLYRYDGTLLQSDRPDATTGTGFVTTSVTAVPDAGTYTLAAATYNGSKLDVPYTVALREGTNIIVFVYEKTLPREQVDVTVIHNYFEDEAAMEAGKTNTIYRDTLTNVDEDSQVTAQERTLAGYVFHSADPENRTITVIAEGKNVIVLNYVRQQSAGYQVIHNYYYGETLEATDAGAVIADGLTGDVILGTDVQLVPERGGYTYEFRNVTEQVVLTEDAVQVIVVSYSRPEVVEIPEEDPPLVDIPEEEPPLADIPEENPPMAEAPKTGDATLFYTALAVLSGMGLTGLLGKKKKEE